MRAVNESTFRQEVLESNEPVLVDFSAAWCGPCRALAPTLERLSDEFSGRAKVVKVDVDEASQLAMRYGVQAVPTLVFFADGREVHRAAGLPSEGALRESIEALAAAHNTAS